MIRAAFTAVVLQAQSLVDPELSAQPLYVSHLGRLVALKKGKNRRARL